MGSGSFKSGDTHAANGTGRSGLPKRTSTLANAAREHVFGWRRKAATAAAGALALVVAYGVIFGHNGLTVYLHKRRETADLQRQMQLLETENNRLQGHVQRLVDDPAAIEHEARESLHYTRAGEVIVTLPNKAPSTQDLPPVQP